MQTSVPLEPGRYYHIYNRGNNRENLFLEERNYRYFMQLYRKHIFPVCDTFAYCLMPNHFHLLVRVRDQVPETCEVLETSQVCVPAKFVAQRFSNFFNSYAKAINTTYHRTGSLFQKRFCRIEVDSEPYFVRLIHYIHFNPQKHGFVKAFRLYPYSSYQTLVSEKPTNLRRAETLDWFQGRKNFMQMHDMLCDEAIIRHLVEEDFD